MGEGTTSGAASRFWSVAQDEVKAVSRRGTETQGERLLRVSVPLPQTHPK
ncbi:MAG: hypothetical protein AVDCRST_MAG68-4592 [uncultured Gemmatimonadetes bacterium]|uniref:Uncharacterized protein n=1 Tax=uncultured Gemmatimonadota bacterium TaxID=203437 RepID=A0A6J4MPE2_9BACT|nr:MAG: hypothetical protein AVDCRST_MAG68-4592 [uncultured Gemmatimonadota bacterium]